MLRILLIILVALAVIIGLMRLTGARPGDAAPPAGTGDAIEEVLETAPASEDLIVDEPAVDALDTPVDIEGDTALEAVEPGAGEAVEAPVEEAPAIAPEPDNAAPVEAPAPDAAETPAADPNAPGL